MRACDDKSCKSTTFFGHIEGGGGEIFFRKKILPFGLVLRQEEKLNDKAGKIVVEVVLKCSRVSHRFHGLLGFGSPLASGTAGEKICDV